jgi:D-cysteine desulfhydrase
VPLGGNKVRALEFLLGAVVPGDEVVTVGATGSTHALATAVYARRLGARTTVYRWPQETNAAARRIDGELRGAADVHDSRTTAMAYVRAALHRLRHQAHWIPAGGTTPLGILGHVDAALELAQQVRDGELPAPSRIVLPLGSGGTAAGLMLGLAIAGFDADVVGVQVVPRVVANRWRIAGLVRATRRLLERASGERVPMPDMRRFSVEHAFYGGAYGRETAAGLAAAECYRAAHGGAMLDATYSAKACAAAMAEHGPGTSLLWVTFDGALLAT